MAEYDEKVAEVWEQLGDHAEAVLATSVNNRVQARTVNMVVIDGVLYFQTSRLFRTTRSIAENPQVAMCVGCIQIEGDARLLGAPAENEAFCAAFKAAFPDCFAAYTNRPGEELFAVQPRFIQRWVRNGSDDPVIERFYCDRQRYTETAY